MVLVPGKEEAARAVFEKWGVDFAVIGVTTDTGRLIIRHNGEPVADMPVPPLADAAPNYDRPYSDLPKPEVLEDPTVSYHETEAVLIAPDKTEDEMRQLAQALIDDRLSNSDLVGAIGMTVSTGEARIYVRSTPDGVSFAGFEEAAINLASSNIIETVRIEQKEEHITLSDAPGGDTVLSALGLLMACLLYTSDAADEN